MRSLFMAIEPNQAGAGKTMENPSVKSVVYVIAAPGRIKVGYSERPEQRLSTLRRNDIEALCLLGSIGGTRRLEKHVHLLLATFRLRGEWYRDCADVRCAVGRLLRGEIREPAPSVQQVAAGNLKDDVRRLVEKVAGSRGVNESRRDWLHRAATAHGLSYRQIKSAFYGELIDPLSKPVTRLRGIANRVIESECVME